MTKLSFPWLALSLGLLILGGLAISGAFSAGGEYLLPLLTLLVVTEFGFFITAIGAGIDIRTALNQGLQVPVLLVTIVCAILAAVFFYIGIHLWPGFDQRGSDASNADSGTTQLRLSRQPHDSVWNTLIRREKSPRRFQQS